MCPMSNRVIHGGMRLRDISRPYSQFVEKHRLQWGGVNFLGYESQVAERVHVPGDSIAGAPGMPKSGHMANQEGKTMWHRSTATTRGKRRWYLRRGPEACRMRPM